MSLKRVAAVAQVAAHGQEVRQGGDEYDRAQQPAVVGVRQEEDQAKAGPADGRHVVDPQQHLPERIARRRTGRLRSWTHSLGRISRPPFAQRRRWTHERAEVRRGRAVAEPLRVVASVQPCVPRSMLDSVSSMTVRSWM